MRTLLKTLPLILLSAAAILAQTGTAVDCSPATITITSSTPTNGISNSNASTPCVSWRVTYNSTGFASVSILAQTSPDNSTWTSVPNNICGSTVQPPCMIDGANPTTATDNGTFAFRAYGRYVRLNPTVSASGTVTAKMFGYKGLSANAGTAGGGGGGGGGITQTTTITPNSLSSAPAAAVPLTGWSLQNTSNAKESLMDFYPNQLVMTSPNNGTNQWGAATRSVSVPYTVIAQLQLRGTIPGAAVGSVVQVGALCISDGTKYEQIEIQSPTSASDLVVATRTLATLSTAGTQANATSNVVGMFVAFKITNNATTRTLSYWSNGAYVTLLSEAAGTFLTETNVGLCSLNNIPSGGYRLDLAVFYWSGA